MDKIDKNRQEWTRWLAGDYDFVNPVNPEILSKSMVFSSLGRSFLDKIDKNRQEWTRWLSSVVWCARFLIRLTRWDKIDKMACGGL